MTRSMEAVTPGGKSQPRPIRDDRRPNVRLSRRLLVWLGLILSAYFVVAALTPFKADLPIIDEPIFAESAYHFAETGQIVLPDLAAPTSIFGTFWGGTFARLFGSTYGTLRWSTVLLFALSAPFMYAICRQLGATEKASLVGTAAYLFNPLSLTLAFSFMTDGRAVALTVISAAFTLQGLRTSVRRLWYLAAGSGLASLAFLSRQQALAVVVAALLAWLFHAKAGKERLIGAVVIAAPPAITYWLHSVWITSVGEPFIRSLSRQELLTTTWSHLAGRGGLAVLLFLTFLGVFALPLAPLLMPDGSYLRRVLSRPLVVAVSLGVAIVGARVVVGPPGLLGRDTWVSATGFQGVDGSVVGLRPPLLSTPLMAVLGIALFASSVIFVTAMARPKVVDGNRPARVFATTMIIGFVLAAYLSSLAFHPTVQDRYWLPALPPVIALAVAHGWSSPRRLAVSLALVAALGAVTTVGIRDAFVAYEEIAVFADEVIASGVDPRDLDAGASWMGHQFGPADIRTPAFDGYPKEGPWWTFFYGTGPWPEHVISLQPLPGHEAIGERREFSSILHTTPTYIYLLRRAPDDSTS